MERRRRLLRREILTVFMTGSLSIIVLGALAMHVVRYRSQLLRTRAADRQRLPVGPDGIVPGAQSIVLNASSSHAVLLIHGFGDTPQTLRGLASHLHDVYGWTVHAPLLPGHGRTLAAFDATRGDAWLTAVQQEYDELCRQYRTVALVGLSMGGALATLIAARDAALPALVLLAPYLTPPARAERLAPLAGLVALLMPYLRGGDRTASIFDPAARARSLGAGAVSPRRIRDLVAVAHDARYAAADVHAPTLLVHSRTDYRIPVAQAERHAGFFTSAVPCEQRWVEGAGHVITVDFGHERVWSATADWLEQYAGPVGQPALPVSAP
jgi:carboxylesterase